MKFKREKRKVSNKIVDCILQLHAHNGSGFDTWIILNNLPCDKHIVDIIKNGNGINFLRVCNGYIQNNKKHIPQYLILRCGMKHLVFSLKKIGKTFILQKELVKTEMNHKKLTLIWREKKR